MSCRMFVVGLLSVVSVCALAADKADKVRAVNSALLEPNNLVIPAKYVSMQTRIFLPNKPPYDKMNWAETVMGQIIAPLVEQSPDLKWYWFSRYGQPLENGDNNDTDITKITKDFFIEDPESGMKIHRSLRLRFCIPAKKLADFEARAEKLIKAQGCMITDWRDWNLSADLGGDRSIGENVTPARRAERGLRTVNFYHSTCELTLHCLVGPDQNGYFRFENNMSDQAPMRSSFETPHHVFCNITDVPMCVLLTGDDKQINVGTFASPPRESLRNLGQVRIRF